VKQFGVIQAQNEVKGSPQVKDPSRSSKVRLAARRNQPTVPDYMLMRQIGGGEYGEVWLARSNATGVLLAGPRFFRPRRLDRYQSR